MPAVKFQETLLDEEDSLGYVTKCGTFAAVPYGKGQFIIIHRGEQIRTCKTITTAKSFITKEMRKLK